MINLRKKLISASSDMDVDLLKNPDRGFRLETWCNVANTSDDYQRVHEDPADMLKKFAAYYAPESPQLAQAYFYLTGFKNNPVISNYGMQRIQLYFDEAKRLGVKLLVRFAYQGDMDGTGEASDDIMISHMQQLKPLLEKNRGLIHVVQSGFLGAWGEWHSYKMEHDRDKLIHAIADMVPPELYLNIRIPEFKNIISKNDPIYNRIGYNNDSVFGVKAGGTGGVDPGTPDWQQVTVESPFVPVDGELFWGTWSMNEHGNDRDGFIIDGYKVILNLSEHRFNSLSVHHNYREDGLNRKYSMQYWKENELTEEWLTNNKLIYATGWFKDSYGRHIQRNVFDYVRDYLGYKLELQEVSISGKCRPGETVQVKLSLVNYGFSVPFNMVSGFALLNSKYEHVINKSAGDPLQWHSRNPEDYNDAALLSHKITAELSLPEKSGIYKLGFYLRNSAGCYARTGNQEEFINGYTILDEISVE